MRGSGWGLICNSKDKEIKDGRRAVRIAPSPTGPMHVGTAYQALFDWVWARQNKGQFVLRIEDTDQARSQKKYEDELMQSLRWLGLAWDEGPDVGGPCGPYRQSERLSIYAEYAAKLVDSGHAYPCFCTGERLAALRAEQQERKEHVGYDGHCRGLSAKEVEAKMQAGCTHVIRLEMPKEGACIVEDMLRGPISLEWGNMDDQVLMKSDGFPTYHLAVVVDDHLMRISHVIRGEEWITSTPKHLMLYEVFGWTPPTYMHLPVAAQSRWLQDVEAAESDLGGVLSPRRLCAAGPTQLLGAHGLPADWGRKVLLGAISRAF